MKDKDQRQSGIDSANLTDETPEPANQSGFRWTVLVEEVVNQPLKAIDIVVCLLLIYGAAVLLSPLLNIDTQIVNLPTILQRTLKGLGSLLPFLLAIIYLVLVRRWRSRRIQVSE